MTLLTLVLILSQTDEAPAAEASPTSAAEEAPAPTPPVPAPPMPPAPPPSPWTVGVSAGLTWATGNVSSLSFVAGANALRKTDRTLFSAKLFAAYGEKFSDGVSP